MSKINSEKILGVDFGTKKIGIAVSDKDKNFALPKLVLKNDKDLLKNIKKIIEENCISEIVIGESLDYKGGENIVMQDIKKFVNELKVLFPIPVTFEPEFLTTAQSKNIQGKTSLTDASAAALILQSFLDKRKNT